MKTYKIVLTTAALLCVLSALTAEPEPPLHLAAIRHTYDRTGETLTFFFQDAQGKPASTLPRPEISYNENSRYIRLSFDGVVAELENMKAEGAAVSSIEIQTVREKTVVYVFLRKSVRNSLRESRRAASLALGLYDPQIGGFWVRVKSPAWRSLDAAYPFWSALKNASIMTCLLQDESGDYFLSTTADYDTEERAAKVMETAQAVIDALMEQDILQPCRPLASLASVADLADPSEAQPPEGELAGRIDSLVGGLAEDPANIHAAMRHEKISATMRELIDIGPPAIPAVALAAASGDERLRRSALLTLAAIGTRDAAQFLIDGLDDAEPSIRQEMVLALERLPMTRAVLLALKDALADEDKWVRFFAARALTRSLMPVAVPVLMNLLADEEVRDEAADIVQRFICAGVSSETFAGLPPQQADAAVKKLLADWEVNREFIPPFPSLEDSSDILERVFARIYNEDDVRCGADEKSGEVIMTRRAPGAPRDAEKQSRVRIVRRLLGNLDGDAAPEELVIVGEGEATPSDMAILDDDHHRGKVIWLESLDANARTGDARAWLTDIDADGVCEIILMVMTRTEGVTAVKTTVYRAKEDGFAAVFSADTCTEAKPAGEFDRPVRTRSFIRFDTASSRDILLDTTTAVGTGQNVASSTKTDTYTWNNGAYQMSETARQAAPDQPGQTDALPQAAGKIEIIADKSDKKLFVYIDGELQKTYNAKFGEVEGDKEIEGDMKTPEGEFYICLKNPNSRYRLSLGLSYPDREDAERGLKRGLITQEERDRIVQAIDRKTTPPWKTALGGEIFIHGDAESREFTHGCIAISNRDIEELYKIANIGTRVVIRP